MSATAVIEQLEIFKNGRAHLGTSSPCKLVNEFELEAGKETFGHRVVPAIASPAHAAAQPVLSEQLLVIPARVLGEFKRSSQHLDRRNCDDYSKAPFGLVQASTVAVAGPASGSTTGKLSAVLGIDCGRRFK